MAKKLYHIYFISDAARARSLEAELDGIVYLTEKQAAQLQELGKKIAEDDAGEFVLDSNFRPYTLKEVMAELPTVEERAS